MRARPTGSIYSVQLRSIRAMLAVASTDSDDIECAAKYRTIHSRIVLDTDCLDEVVGLYYPVHPPQQVRNHLGVFEITDPAMVRHTC